MIGLRCMNGCSDFDEGFAHILFMVSKSTDGHSQYYSFPGLFTRTSMMHFHTIGTASRGEVKWSVYVSSKVYDCGACDRS